MVDYVCVVSGMHVDNSFLTVLCEMRASVAATRDSNIRIWVEGENCSGWQKSRWHRRSTQEAILKNDLYQRSIVSKVIACCLG